MAKQSATIFTKTLLDNSRPPKGMATLVLTDGRVAGFQCLIGKNTRTFSYKGYFNNEPFRILIGRYPQFSIEEARAKAFDFDQKVKKGIDPRYVPGENLEAALEDAMARRIADDKLSAKTADDYRRMIKFTCKSWLNRDIKTITDAEIERLKHKLAKAGKKATANQIIAILSMVWRVHKLPPFHIEKYTLPARKSKIGDWAVWYESVSKLDHQTKRNCRLFLALTGLRSENGRSIRWEQVDMDKKTVFLPKTKTTNDQLLPLSQAAAAAITEQIGLNEKFVFPSHYKDRHIVELRHPTVPGTVHDLRKMFTQAARRLKMPAYAIAMLRCDRPKTTQDEYDGEIAPHEWAEQVSAELHRRWHGGEV